MPSLPRIDVPGPSSNGGGAVQLDDVGPLSPRQGRRVDIIPGFYWYLSYVTAGDENTLFTQVGANWEKLNAAWSVRAWLLRRELKDRWAALSSRQRELIAWARRVDAGWQAMGVEGRAQSVKDAWESLVRDIAAWNGEAAGYSDRCAGRSAGASAPQDCARLYNRLVADLTVFRQRQAAIERDWAGLAGEMNAYFASTRDYDAAVEAWQRDLIQFNAKLLSSVDSSRRVKNQEHCKLLYATQELDCVYVCESTGVTETRKWGSRKGNAVICPNTLVRDIPGEDSGD